MVRGGIVSLRVLGVGEAGAGLLKWEFGPDVGMLEASYVLKGLDGIGGRGLFHIGNRAPGEAAGYSGLKLLFELVTGTVPVWHST